MATSALLGRSDQVGTLVGMLVDRSRRLVTLTGPPGVGKTRLALEVAAKVSSDFADGVAWVDLGQVHSVEQVPAELASGLGAERVRDATPLESMVSVLTDRDLLLVVDNFEHLLDAAPTIGTLLDRLPRLHVLATSRRRLHLLAETEYPVPPLPVPAVVDADDLAGLAGNPAVELLLARAPAPVALNRRTARPLIEICLRLDGLPLALELAAARLRVFTPSELVFRLEHRTVGLVAAARDAPARHQTLTAAIQWSHDLLPDAERTVFRRLAVLSGEWTVPAAQDVCGLAAPVTLAAIESLLDQNLLHRIPADGPARFRMLASLREYAQEQLVAADELHQSRHRHADHFAGVAAAWEATLGTPAENATWAEFDATYADLAAAFDHAPLGQARAWLGVGLAWHGHIHGSLVHAATVLDALHEMEQASTVDGVPASVEPETQLATLTAAGVAGLGLGEFTRAAHDLQSAVDLSTARADERRQAVALSFLGHVARGMGNAAEAAQHYRSARAICERRGNVRGTAWAAFDLGLLAVDEQDPSAVAEPLLREALTYFDDLGYDWAQAQAARGLALALLACGAVDEAGRLLARSLLLHKEVGDRRGSAQCLEALAEVAAARGSLTGAARLIGAAQTQRQLGATTPTAGERHRLQRVDAEVDAALGRVAADHEKHGGRTAPSSAVLAFAVEIAEPKPAPAFALTTRQVQVADLVATGRTNRQIARALGISEKTAEIHVSNIMGRLRVPSRAGVAAWVAARPPSGPLQPGP